MVEIRKGRTGEAGVIAEFIDKAFDNGIDIKSLLPKVFCSASDFSERFRLLFHNGTLCAALLCWPLKWVLDGGRTVDGVTVGSVCVDVKCRGLGLMRQLMGSLDNELKSSGVAFSVLNGDRHLYRQFGYEMAGAHETFFVTASSVDRLNRHNARDLPELTIVPLEENPEHVRLAWELHGRGKPRVMRERHDFAAILSSWNSKPYAVLKDGVLIGYFSIAESGAEDILWEASLTGEKLYPSLAAAIFSTFRIETLKVILPEEKTAAYNFFSDICDSRNTSWNHNYKIYRPELLPPQETFFISELDLA